MDFEEKLDSKDWKVRSHTIEQVEILLKAELAKPNSEFEVYVEDITLKMLKMCIDSNFKVSLTALRIINLLTHQFASQIMPHFEHVSEALIRKLEDNKIVIRHSIIKIFHNLSSQTGFQRLTELAIKYLEHPRWHVREECLSLLIMTCLSVGN